MLSEKIKIPASGLHDKSSTAEPLLQSTGFQSIQLGYEGSGKSYDDAVEAASQMARLIRACITFSDHTPDQPALSPEWVGNAHKTNCHGHSIIASECLDELEVEHFIGFANQHSFLLMEDAETGRVNLIDTPVEKLCGDITPALGGIALRECDEDIGSATFISGNMILQRSQFANKHMALERRPWLSFLAGKGEKFLFRPEDEQNRAGQLILRTYRPEQGRNILLNYDSFVHSAIRRDTQRAHEWLRGLDRTYPDIDTRNNLRAPTWLVRALGLSALVDEALEDIAIVENSLTPFTNDLLLRLWPADEIRRVGIKVKSADLITQSMKSYDEIYETRKDSGASTGDIEQRIRKARSQLSRLT